MSINKAVIGGNLTRDAELRSTASGYPILGFSVAVNDRVKENGEWVDKPNYFDCTMFGTRAEKIAQYLSKGTKVVVEGKLRWSQWEQNGQKRSKVEIIVDEIEFMTRGDSSYASSYGAAAYAAPASAPLPAQMYAPPASMPYGGQAPAPMPYAAPEPPVGQNASSVYDEDIPF